MRRDVSRCLSRSASLERPRLRDDCVHRDVVRLRADCLEAAELEAHSDRERARRQAGEGPIVVAAAVTEPIARVVHSDQRNQQDIRPHGIRLGRDRYAPDALTRQPRLRAVTVELDRRVLLDDHRQRGREAPLEQRADERPQVRLAADRPIEPDAANRTVQCRKLPDPLRYRVAEALTLRERQGTAPRARTRPLRSSPALDVFPVPQRVITAQAPPGLRSRLAATPYSNRSSRSGRLGTSLQSRAMLRDILNAVRRFSPCLESSTSP